MIRRGRVPVPRPISLPILISLLLPTMVWGVENAPPFPRKPYRVLLIVEKWSDPSSILVDHEKDEFQPVAALLKA